jgi:hypothetical protein
MTSSFKNIKTKIALHSFGVCFVFSLLFIFSIFFVKNQLLPYSIAGLITAEVLRIVFSKKKYIISLRQDGQSISINYFNRLLIEKSIEISKENLKVTDVVETNWWLGRLDFINFLNDRQNITFDYIDKYLKQSLAAKIGEV